jgi:hypothetical protein
MICVFISDSLFYVRLAELVFQILSLVFLNGRELMWIVWKWSLRYLNNLIVDPVALIDDLLGVLILSH